MAYNRRNYYKRVLEVQKITLREQANGRFLNEIYYEFIQKRYHISYKTFYNYLGINAKRGLRLLEEKDRQTKLFDQ